jgi:pimeloyl-ACP methyl ester carboxylesterase
MTAPVEELRFEAGDLSVAALAWGSPGDRLALCLHGYPDTAWTWRHLGPYLAQRGWRVVAPFQRGYAPTALAPDRVYQIGALARDAIEAHAALGGDDRTVLIGHDWGAAATYCAASFAPERFARAVTLAVPPGPAFFALPRTVPDLVLSARQLRRSWYMGFQQLPIVSEAALDRLIPRLWADWSPGYDAAEDLDHVWAALPDPAHRTAVLRYYRALAQPWERSRAYAAEQAHMMRLPRQPLLYLYGEHDGCLLPAVSERTRALVGPDGAVHAVPDAGHFLQLERPETVNELIGDFIGT